MATSAKERLGHRSRQPESPPRMRSDDVEPESRPAARRRAPAGLGPSDARGPGGRRVAESPPRRALRPTPVVRVRNVSPALEKRRSVYRSMMRQDLEAGQPSKFRASGSRTQGEQGPIFQGSEFGTIELKEQKKIQIDIRRNIPAHKVSHSPVRRHLSDSDQVLIPRAKDEGAKPLFDRPDILECLREIAQEVRSVNLIPEAAPSTGLDRVLERRPRSRSRSRSPVGLRHDLRQRMDPNHHRHESDRRAMDEDTRGRRSIRDRLGEVGVKSRLGEDMPHQRPRGGSNAILDRDELERQRPQVKPWEVNPEFVPRGRNYFEHDDREGAPGFERSFDFDDRRGRDFRRGGRRGGWQRGGGGGGRFNARRGRDTSPEWKHDKFEDNNRREEETMEA